MKQYSSEIYSVKYFLMLKPLMIKICEKPDAVTVDFKENCEQAWNQTLSVSSSFLSSFPSFRKSCLYHWESKDSMMCIHQKCLGELVYLLSTREEIRFNGGNGSFRFFSCPESILHLNPKFCFQGKILIFPWSFLGKA